MLICDSHTHSHNSHDALSPVSQMAEAALQNGLHVLTVTDHCDIQYYHKHDTPGRLEACFRETAQVAEQYRGQLTLLTGIELGEGILSPEYTADILRRHPYDVVIGSVHQVNIDDIQIPYSYVDFTTKDQPQIERFLHQYFNDMAQMLRDVPCDIMAHLTCPIRYLNGKYGKGVALSPFAAQIDDILRYIIAHNIALEVNSSGIDAPLGALMPDEDILGRYRQLGGRLVTIGSDAHCAQRVGVGLDSAIRALQKAGFTGYYYYQQRKPILCKI